MSHTQHYLSLWIVGLIAGIGSYHVGYDVARQEHYKPVHFKCHEGIVYRGVYNHWESTGQKCLTPEQMKGVV